MRKADEVRLTGPQGTLTTITSLAITNDLTQPADCAIEVGDDVWDEISPYIEMGSEYEVTLNDRPRMKGRIELRDIPADADGGACVRFTLISKLSDAMYASALPVQVGNTTLKAFIEKLLDPILTSPDNMDFTKEYIIWADEWAAARDLMTGKISSRTQMDFTKIDLERMKVPDAKVQPNETIWDAADRHLRRHGLMLWDGPDGRLVVGAPNIGQEPTYYLRMRRGTLGANNNIIAATRTQDYTAAPSALSVHGQGGAKGYPRGRVSSVAWNDDVIAAGLYHPVTIAAEGAHTSAMAERTAARELANRSRRSDLWEVEVDGLTYWNGRASVPWAMDTIVDIISDVAGGPLGAYYCYRCAIRRDAVNGDVSCLSLARPQNWRI